MSSCVNYFEIVRTGIKSRRFSEEQMTPVLNNGPRVLDMALSEISEGKTVFRSSSYQSLSKKISLKNRRMLYGKW